MRLRLGTLSLLAMQACWQAADLRSRSQRVFDEASATKPTGDAYHQALNGGYMEHATYEQEEMMHYTSAISHSRNAMAAARGETPVAASPISARSPPTRSTS